MQSTPNWVLVGFACSLVACVATSRAGAVDCPCQVRLNSPGDDYWIGDKCTGSVERIGDCPGYTWQGYYGQYLQLDGEEVMPGVAGLYDILGVGVFRDDACGIDPECMCEVPTEVHCATVWNNVTISPNGQFEVCQDDWVTFTVGLDPGLGCDNLGPDLVSGHPVAVDSQADETQYPERIPGQPSTIRCHFTGCTPLDSPDHIIVSHPHASSDDLAPNEIDVAEVTVRHVPSQPDPQVAAEALCHGGTELPAHRKSSASPGTDLRTPTAGRDATERGFVQQRSAT